MGVAQFYCCVGGHVSCIGAWGVGTPCALPFIRLDAIILQSVTVRKRFFRTLHCSGPLFLLFRGWCIAYRRRGWPATDGAGVHIDGWEQGGVRGVFRSMQFPAVGLVVACRLVPVGIASLLRLRA